MDPAEKRLRIAFAHPRQGTIDHGLATALAVDLVRGRFVGSEIVVLVLFEAMVEAEFAIEHKRGDEGPRVVALPLRTSASTGERVIQPPAAIGADPVFGRVQPGEQTRMGRQSEGATSIRPFA